MRSVHQLIIKACVAEVLQGGKHEHDLLVAAGNIIVRNNEAHRGMLLLRSDIVERCGFVNDHAALVLAAVFENGEVLGWLSRIVKPSRNFCGIDTVRAEIRRIEAEHHRKIAPRRSPR